MADVPIAVEAPKLRLAAIDLVRGVAIVAMVVYHTAFDLAADGLIGVDVEGDLGWKIFARSVAGTFLLLVGIGLVLATRRGFDRNAYLRRLGLIVIGAALVSLGTYWFDPTTYVFFGILHEIALASVLALPFLLLPSAVVAIAAAAILAAPWFLANPFFDRPYLWWIGLSPEPPTSIDFVPVLPWLGVVLAGIVVGRLIAARQAMLAQWQPKDAASRALIAAGRWSLAIYLIHQPLIVGALYLLSVVAPPSVASVRERFVADCTSACTTKDHSAAECTAVCGCMFDNLHGTDLYSLRSTAEMTPDQESRFDAIVEVCRPPPPP